ncbi:DUF1868 domain-containing protein [Pseudomonas chlororaphis]|uniref:DUF1868 domain-containing protein n=1 Tax=Pseudomonas chlororaphis TaxID=587753 RepID=A0A1Q8EV15_9PSED|nr:DUF1868 domain-containing protein [Pseudomonas chlororaphis]OLF55639.1 hypothetical protein BTN82_06755 [Pseudomonas chlororaphis]
MKNSGQHQPTKEILPGGKWDSEGNALYFPGITCVGRIPSDSDFFEMARKARDIVQCSEFSSQYAYTPLASYHMTGLDILSEASRIKPDADWPEDISRSESWPEITMKIFNKINNLTLDPAPPLLMRATGFQPLEKKLVVSLQPGNTSVSEWLRYFRHRMMQAIGLPETTLNSYHFHSTVGYRIYYALPNEKEALLHLQEKLNQLVIHQAPEVTIEPLQYCAFTDMLAFVPLKHFL